MAHVIYFKLISQQDFQEDIMQDNFLDINQLLLIKKIYAKHMKENSELCSSFAVFAEIMSNKKIESQQELTKLVGCNKAHTSRTLLKMQLKGLVKLGKDITLTSKGEEYAGKVKSLKQELYDTMFDGVTEKEKEVFARVLDKVIKNSKVVS